MDEILIGKNGVLFHATSVHKILEHITGRIAIDPKSFENFSFNIKNREKICLERNIKYRHVVFPDKSTVMRSYFPIADIVPFSSHYRPYYTDSVLDLADYLPDSDAHYQSVDTHLNFDGMVKTTVEIMKTFIQLDDEVEVMRILSSYRGPAREVTGDLGSKMNPPQTGILNDISTKFAKRYNNQVGANDGLAIVCLNRDMLGRGERRRLLVFADSFMERSLQLFAHFYSEILFCRSRYLHEEVVDMFKPDHLITASAERYFSYVRLDEVAPRFDLIYGLRGHKYSSNLDFYTAYNAVLNFGKPQYDIFIKRFLMGAI